MAGTVETPASAKPASMAKDAEKSLRLNMNDVPRNDLCAKTSADFPGTQEKTAQKHASIFK
jgi:hypothetical protein